MAGILETICKFIIDYVLDQEKRGVDILSNKNKVSDSDFKRIYDNRASKGEWSRKIVEDAASKRNWKG